MRSFGKRVLILLAIIVITGCANRRPELQLDIVVPRLQKIEKQVRVKIEWQSSTGIGSRGQIRRQLPVAENEEIYFCDGRQVRAIRARNGRWIWRKRLDNILSGCLGSFGDSLYVSDEEGIVYSLNAEDGELNWQTELEINSDTPPTANQNIVLVQSSTEKLFALDANSGTQLWSYSAFNPGISLLGSFRPALVGSSVFSGFADGSIVIFDQITGNVRNFSQVVIPQGSNDIERLVDIDSDALFVDNTIFISSYGETTLALDLNTGQELWRQSVGSSRPMFLYNDKLLIVDRDDRIHALDTTTGEIMWTNEELRQRVLSAPVLHDDYLIVGDIKGYVHVLSAETGTSVGRRKLFIAQVKDFMLSIEEGVLVHDTEGFIKLVSIQER